MMGGVKAVGTLSNQAGEPVMFNAEGILMGRTDGGVDFILPIEGIHDLFPFQDSCKASLVIYEPEGFDDVYEISLRKAGADNRTGNCWAIWETGIRQ